MGELILFLGLTLFSGHESSRAILDTGLLGGCVAAIIFTMAIFGIVLAALKDNRADQYYQ